MDVNLINSFLPISKGSKAVLKARRHFVKTASKSIERFDLHFVHRLRHVSGRCDLDLGPKVTNFNRV